MASPITIGTTAMVVALKSAARADIRFQNTGSSTIYIKKIPLSGAFSTVTSTDYEVKILPFTSEDADEEDDDRRRTGEGEAFETNSIAGFMAVSSSSHGLLAIYETKHKRSH